MLLLDQKKKITSQNNQVLTEQKLNANYARLYCPYKSLRCLPQQTGVSNLLYFPKNTSMSEGELFMDMPENYPLHIALVACATVWVGLVCGLLLLLLLLLLSSGPGAYAPDAPQPVGSLCYPCTILEFIRFSHFRRQSVSPERPLVVKGGTAWARNIAGNFCLKCRLPRYILGIFYMMQIYDMGPMALLPLRRKVC